MGRIAKLKQEQAFITHELTRWVGLRGRDRKDISAAERARVSVTHAIRFVIRRLAKLQPELGTFLSAAMRTGQYCSFVAELMPGPRLQDAPESPCANQSQDN